MGAATEQHARSYSQSMAISYRWENDNTSPEIDSRNLQGMLHAFRFPRAEKFVIPMSEPVPGFTVRDKLLECSKPQR